MQVFVTINNIGMMINAGANFLVKVYVIKDIFGILVIVNVNVIHHVMLENIFVINIVSAGKNKLINRLKNILKLLMK